MATDHSDDAKAKIERLHEKAAAGYRWAATCLRDEALRLAEKIGVRNKALDELSKQAEIYIQENARLKRVLTAEGLIEYAEENVRLKAEVAKALAAGWSEAADFIEQTGRHEETPTAATIRASFVFALRAMAQSKEGGS
jgi:hypothetical protein